MFFIDKMIAELSLTSLEWVRIGSSWERTWEPTEEGKIQYQKENCGYVQLGHKLKKSERLFFLAVALERKYNILSLNTL